MIGDWVQKGIVITWIMPNVKVIRDRVDQ